MPRRYPLEPVHRDILPSNPWMMFRNFKILLTDRLTDCNIFWLAVIDTCKTVYHLSIEILVSAYTWLMFRGCRTWFTNRLNDCIIIWLIHTCDNICNLIFKMSVFFVDLCMVSVHLRYFKLIVLNPQS